MNLALALGALALLVMSSNKRGTATSDKPPPLPAAPLRPVPSGPVVDVPLDPKNYGKPPAQSAALAAAAAASAAAKLSPPMTTPAAESSPPKVAPAAADMELLPQDRPPVTPAAQSPSTPSKALEGYDPDSARRGAKSLASHLKRTGRAGYDRRLLRAWQTKAGLKSDGIYGGETRGALLYYGASDAPQPFFKPTNTIPYTPPET